MFTTSHFTGFCFVFLARIARALTAKALGLFATGDKAKIGRIGSDEPSDTRVNSTPAS